MRLKEGGKGRTCSCCLSGGNLTICSLLYIRLRASYMRLYQTYYFSQVKSALPVVGTSSIAHYCKVKTMSNPARKALEEAVNLKQLPEMHLATTYNLKSYATGIFCNLTRHLQRIKSVFVASRYMQRI